MRGRRRRLFVDPRRVERVDRHRRRSLVDDRLVVPEIALEQLRVHRRKLRDAGMEVGHVQEARLRESDVDERRLHSRQYADDFALVDVADDAAVACALDVHLRERIVLHERDPHLFGRRVDQDQLGHGAAAWTVTCGCRGPAGSASVVPIFVTPRSARSRSLKPSTSATT
jgi:hypothetical protein